MMMDMGIVSFMAEMTSSRIHPVVMKMLLLQVITAGGLRRRRGKEVGSDGLGGASCVWRFLPRRV